MNGAITGGESRHTRQPGEFNLAVNVLAESVKKKHIFAVRKGITI
jgi:hypothetical protein